MCINKICYYIFYYVVSALKHFNTSVFIAKSFAVFPVESLTSIDPCFNSSFTHSSCWLPLAKCSAERRKSNTFKLEIKYNGNLFYQNLTTMKNMHGLVQFKPILFVQQILEWRWNKPRGIFVLSMGWYVILFHLCLHEGKQNSRQSTMYSHFFSKANRESFISQISYILKHL